MSNTATAGLRLAERELRVTLAAFAESVRLLTGADGVVLAVYGDLNDGAPLRFASCEDQDLRMALFREAQEAGANLPEGRNFRGVRLADTGRIYLKAGGLFHVLSESFPDFPITSEGKGRKTFTFQLVNFFRDRTALDDAAQAACSLGWTLLRSIMDQWCERCFAEVDRETTFMEVLRYRRRAELDGLTLVENAVSFRQICERRLASAERELALVLIDLDHFKSINDIYGHQFGDTYLKAIGRSLGGLRALDSVVGRIGGDEFAILLEASRITDSYLQVILHQINAKVQRDLTKLKKPNLGRMSMGVAVHKRDGETFEELFQRADAALYAIKAQGRNGVAIFDSKKHGQYDRRSLSMRFERAIEEGEIIPYFQPIVDLRTGVCYGFEALARWLDKDMGMLLPSSFSAVMRDHSQAEKLTFAMARQGLAMLSRIRDVPGMRNAKLTLNVTHFDLMRPEFVFDLQEWLTETNVGWNALRIEVTEQTMLGDIEGQVFRTLAELRTRGALVALDDFGTGYGGLEHLATWPVDMIKIDRNFIAGLEDTRAGRAVVSGLCRIARDLGLGIVAEGIETKETEALLIQLGCTYGQGYLYSKPVPESKVAEVWAAINAEAGGRSESADRRSIIRL